MQAPLFNSVLPTVVEHHLIILVRVLQYFCHLIQHQPPPTEKDPIPFFNHYFCHLPVYFFFYMGLVCLNRLGVFNLRLDHCFWELRYSLLGGTSKTARTKSMTAEHPSSRRGLSRDHGAPPSIKLAR